MSPRRPKQGEITSKDVRKVIERAIDAGWSYRLTRSNHAQLLAPDGQTIIGVAGSSSDRHAANIVARALRKHGVPV